MIKLFEADRKKIHNKQRNKQITADFSQKSYKTKDNE